MAALPRIWIHDQSGAYIGFLLLVFTCFLFSSTDNRDF
jgi:hypothetical protein